MSADPTDFVALKARFDGNAFPTGARAELRRVIDPEAVALCPALYRLFPGQTPDVRHWRLAFLLPWCSHDAKAKPLGAQLATSQVSEARVLQVARARTPADFIQLRRLLAHIEPAVDWAKLGRTVWYWSESAKRELVEDYYLAKFTPVKGAK